MKPARKKRRFYIAPAVLFELSETTPKSSRGSYDFIAGRFWQASDERIRVRMLDHALEETRES